MTGFTYTKHSTKHVLFYNNLICEYYIYYYLLKATKEIFRFRPIIPITVEPPDRPPVTNLNKFLRNVYITEVSAYVK